MPRPVFRLSKEAAATSEVIHAAKAWVAAETVAVLRGQKLEEHMKAVADKAKVAVEKGQEAVDLEDKPGVNYSDLAIPPPVVGVPILGGTVVAAVGVGVGTTMLTNSAELGAALGSFTFFFEGMVAGLTAIDAGWIFRKGVASSDATQPRPWDKQREIDMIEDLNDSRRVAASRAKVFVEALAVAEELNAEVKAVREGLGANATSFEIATAMKASPPNIVSRDPGMTL